MKKKSDLAALYRSIDEARADYIASLDFGLRARIDSAKRRKAAGRSVRRLYERVAREGGLDLSIIDSLHDKDLKAAQKTQKVLLEAARARAVQRAERRREKVRQVRKLRKRFERERGNPTKLVCLWVADRINFSSVGFGTSSFDSPQLRSAFGDNRLGTRVSASANGNITLFTFFDFIWNCDVDGMLNATGWVSLDGTYSLIAPGACFSSSRAIMGVTAFISVAQDAGAGDFTVGVQRAIPPLFTDSLDADCSTELAVGEVLHIEEETVDTTTALPVEPGRPVIASVTVALQCGASNNGEALIDMLSGGTSFGVTVPSIWLTVRH